MNMNMAAGAYGSMQSEGRWWEAFGTGGYEGEPGLMEGMFVCFVLDAEGVGVGVRVGGRQKELSRHVSDTRRLREKDV
jgi:hypothetical protein